MREIVDVLRANYCGPVGLEYMHINDLEERRFLQDRMEGKDKPIQFTPEGKRRSSTKVIHGEQWEKFLAKQICRHQALRPRRRRKRMSRRSKR